MKIKKVMLMPWVSALAAIVACADPTELEQNGIRLHLEVTVRRPSPVMDEGQTTAHGSGTWLYYLHALVENTGANTVRVVTRENPVEGSTSDCEIIHRDLGFSVSKNNGHKIRAPISKFEPVELRPGEFAELYTGESLYSDIGPDKISAFFSYSVSHDFGEQYGVWSGELFGKFTFPGAARSVAAEQPPASQSKPEAPQEPLKQTVLRLSKECVELERVYCRGSDREAAKRALIAFLQHAEPYLEIAKTERGVRIDRVDLSWLRLASIYLIEKDEAKAEDALKRAMFYFDQEKGFQRNFPEYLKDKRRVLLEFLGCVCKINE